MHHPRSTRLSRRAVAAVALLLAAVAALLVVVAGADASAHERRPRPAPPPAAPLTEAVARTIAEPFARVHLELTPSKGPRLTIAGIAGLADDDADLSLTVEGRDAPARFRVIGDQAWVEVPHVGWAGMAAADVGAGLTSWRTLVRKLRPDADAATGASLGGHPATVELDPRGRIAHVRARLPRSTFDLRLDGYDEDLVITPPP